MSRNNDDIAAYDRDVSNGTTRSGADLARRGTRHGEPTFDTNHPALRQALRQIMDNGHLAFMLQCPLLRYPFSTPFAFEDVLRRLRAADTRCIQIAESRMRTSVCMTCLHMIIQGCTPTEIRDNLRLIFNVEAQHTLTAIIEETIWQAYLAFQMENGPIAQPRDYVRLSIVTEGKWTIGSPRITALMTDLLNRR